MKKKKILLLGDNITKFTGVGIIGNSIVKGTVDSFDWIQIAGASTTDINTRIDVSSDYKEKTSDANVILYPVKDYGNQDYLRFVIEQEKPDAILHITDPRYWMWMYDMEYEIHQHYKIPIVYYAIWDNYPAPKWNYPLYESSDVIISISKLSDEIHKEVTKQCKNQPSLQYVPHGVDPDIFYPINSTDSEYEEVLRIKDEFSQRHGAKKIFFWNNVNMSRKRPADVMRAYAVFCRRNKEYLKNSCLVMHTSIVSQAGTDLLTVKRHLFDDCNIIFSTEKISPELLNYYYNISAASINISHSEGFGLSNLESLMAGCPTITHQTGGLKDQSITEATYKVETSHKVLSGSLATPYIYQDYCSVEDVANGLEWAYNITPEQRQELSKESRRRMIKNGFTSNQMAYKIESILLSTLQTWKPAKPYQIISIND